MSDYVLRGTRNLVDYMRTLGTDTNEMRQRVAASIKVPLIYLSTSGVPGSTFMSRRYSEAEAQALADLLGVTVANVTTNGGQEIVG